MLYRVVNERGRTPNVPRVLVAGDPYSNQYFSSIDRRAIEVAASSGIRIENLFSRSDRLADFDVAIVHVGTNTSVSASVCINKSGHWNDSVVTLPRCRL